MKIIMELTTDKFKSFHDSNYEFLKESLGEQLQKHFNILVDNVPSIDKIEWTSSQEDSMVFNLTWFRVVKNNGYIFNHDNYSEDKLSNTEFNKKEIEIINGFKNYINGLSKLIVTLYRGSETFRLDKEQEKTNTIASYKKVKL